MQCNSRQIDSYLFMLTSIGTAWHWMTLVKWPKVYSRICFNRTTCKSNIVKMLLKSSLTRVCACMYVCMCVRARLCSLYKHLFHCSQCNWAKQNAIHLLKYVLCSFYAFHKVSFKIIPTYQPIQYTECAN